MTLDACRHGWRHLNRLANPRIVVVDEMKRGREAVIFQLL
jgi:hypothetical protein